MRLSRPRIVAIAFALVIALLAAVAPLLDGPGVEPLETQENRPPDSRQPPPQPPPRPEDAIAVRAEHPFQFLVSYTNTGFEPREARIRLGDTMRFTNNSTGPLWVAAAAGEGELYPGEEGVCGFSALDSCGTLAPGEYWQFTFALGGTWTFVNNLDKAKTAVVEVVAP